MRAQGTQETVVPCSSLHCQHSSWGHEQHCGFVATKSLLTSSVIPAQKNVLIWCSGTQHISMCPRKMLVVGGCVACGPQTRVFQAMRIHGSWKGFACNSCGLWCGRTGETSCYLKKVWMRLGCATSHCSCCPMQAVWCSHCSSVVCKLQPLVGESPSPGKQGLGEYKRKKRCHEHGLTYH